MLEIILISAFFISFVVIVAMTYKMHHHIKFYNGKKEEVKVEKLQTLQNWFYVLIVLSAVCGVFIIYMFLKGTIYESHLFEWMNLAVRWIHITFGVA